jgi:hypothetical protein
MSRNEAKNLPRARTYYLNARVRVVSCTRAPNRVEDRHRIRSF